MHWLGGMGIVVLFVAVFPALGVGGKHLFRSEVPGPRTQGLAPRIRKTSSALWKIYTGFTLLEISMLCLLGGLPLFEALIHSLSTMATGGFSSLNGSVGEFHSPVVEWIVLGFMILAGMNFSLFYEAGQRGWRVFLQHSETRFYFSLLLGATLLCAVCLAPDRFGTQRGWDLTGLLRDAGFQVTAVMTGTGFGTDDFELWPTAAKVVLMGLYFTGGCSGSTSGGMKLFRILVLFKSTGRQITKMIQPHRVVPVRVGRSVIREETRSEVMAFSVCFLFTVAVGALGVALMDEVDGTTSWMASLACVATWDPGWASWAPAITSASSARGASSSSRPACCWAAWNLHSTRRPLSQFLEPLSAHDSPPHRRPALWSHGWTQRAPRAQRGPHQPRDHGRPGLRDPRGAPSPSRRASTSRTSPATC